MKRLEKSVKLYIYRMTCRNCQNKIEQKLKEIKGIIDVSVSYGNGTAQLTYDENIISMKEITACIEKLGYEVSSEKKKTNKDLCGKVGILIVIVFSYFILQSTGILNLLAPSQVANSKMGYGMLWVTGLLTSVHCIVMCGGISLTQSLPEREEKISEKSSRYRIIFPALFYNLGRVFSYTMIGALFGTIGFFAGGGGTFGISMILQGILKILAGLFMVIFGINMLELFPRLRRFTIPVPRFITNAVCKKRDAKNNPFWIGLLNGFMPCGPLQSMWIVALATGNPLSGAMAMLMFALGTVPLMLGLGTAVSALGKKFTDKVMTAGAVLVVILGFSMISQGGSLSGLAMSGEKTVKLNENVSSTDIEIVDGVQVIYSTLSPGSYPDIMVQSGIPVKWIIDASENSINGCNYKIFIREYDIEYTFCEGENVIQFTPTEPGTIPYSCWMGMIRGKISIYDDVDDVDTTMKEIENDTEEISENQRFCCGY